MKVLCIPDVHGRDKWKDPCKAFLEEEEGIIIFLGDYVDAYGISDDDMINNLADIILLKQTYPDRVILLLGNHDFPYINSRYSCSGNRPRIMLALSGLYRSNLNLFQMAYQVHNTLFVHAGLTTDWLDYNNVLIERQLVKTLPEYLEDNTYADLLNMLFQGPERSILYHVSGIHGGYDYWDGPVWVRPSQLIQGLPQGLSQVVGHTHVPKTTVVAHGEQTVTFTDCMATADWEPLILEL